MRLLLRICILTLALARRPFHRRPRTVRKVLVVHHLLLGDVLCLAPLLKKIQAQYPASQRFVTCRPSFQTIFARHPYGFKALVYDPRSWSGFVRLLRNGPYDLVLVIGDNRYSWLAKAVGGLRIVGHADDYRGWKTLMMDETVPFMTSKSTWADGITNLIAGPYPAPYRPNEWSVEEAEDRERPVSFVDSPYVVCHLGASTSLKVWSTKNWQSVVDWLQDKGYRVAVSVGPGESQLASGLRCDRVFWGDLSLGALWKLVQQASLLVSVDTGVAHMGKLTGTPTVALYGPGSAVLHDAGLFWDQKKFRPVTVPSFPCRDQARFFRRTLPWIQRCGRSVTACSTPGACMGAIKPDNVIQAICEVLPPNVPNATNTH